MTNTSTTQFPKLDMKTCFETRLQVQFDRIGANWRANCPFCGAHGALQIDPSDPNRWWCYGCCETGHPYDVTDFEKKLGDQPGTMAASVPASTSPDQDNPELDWSRCRIATGYTGLESYWASQRDFGPHAKKAAAISEASLRIDYGFWKQNGGPGKEIQKSKVALLVAPICDPISGRVIGTQRLSVTDRTFKSIYGTSAGVLVLRGDNSTDVVFVESVANAMALAAIGLNAVCIYSVTNIKVIRPALNTFERDSARAKVKLRYFFWPDAHNNGSHVEAHIDAALSNSPLLRVIRFNDGVKSGYDVNDVLKDNPDTFAAVVRSMLNESSRDKLRENGIDRTSLPAFPVHVFPQWLQEYTQQVAAKTSVPVDFPAAAALPIVGSALGKNITCEIDSEWTESGRIYLSLIGQSGSGKSPAIEKMMVATNLAEKQFAAKNQDKEQRFEQAKDQFEQDRQAYRAQKKSGIAPLYPCKPQQEPLERAYTTNSTVESLSTILADNPSCLLKLDEIKALMSGMNQYKGGKGNDREFYLSADSGVSSPVDRKAGTTYVENPHLCILGATVPENLTALISTEKGNDGLTARFLLVFPDACSSRYSKQKISSESKNRWCDFILDLYRTRQTKRVYELDYESRELFAAHHDCISSWGDSEPNAIMRSWLSKMRGKMARLALILAALHGTEITMQIVNYAFELVQYFEAHARRCFTCADRARAIENGDKDQVRADLAQRIVEYAERRGVNIVNVRNLCRANLRSGLKANDIRNCFAQMVAAGIAKTTASKDSIELVL